MVFGHQFYLEVRGCCHLLPWLQAWRSSSSNRASSQKHTHVLESLWISCYKWQLQSQLWWRGLVHGCLR